MAVQAPVRPTAHSLAAAVGLISNNTRCKDCLCSCAVGKTVDLQDKTVAENHLDQKIMDLNFSCILGNPG